MNRFLILWAIVWGIFATAQNTKSQEGRVGINIDKPRATLDIVGAPITTANKTQARGVILPHISDAQKDKFTDLPVGLTIWNTTKKCVDYWNGTTWICFGDQPTPITYTGQRTATVSKAFTKECPAGYTGSSVTYTATKTATATSTTSQAEANTKAEAEARRLAEADVNANGQNYANANGTCTQNTYTATKSYGVPTDFTKTCPAGQTGSVVRYSTPATATRTSTVSQAEADRLATEAARAEFLRLGQENADRVGTCTQIYTATISYGPPTYFDKICPAGQTGSGIRYATPATATRTSTVSQAEADRLAFEAARAEFLRLGQAEANRVGTCTPNSYSATATATASGNFHKNNCPNSNETSVTVTYTATKTATEYSTISYEHARQLAQAKAQSLAENDVAANGQNYANNTGQCGRMYLTWCGMPDASGWYPHREVLWERVYVSPHLPGTNQDAYPSSGNPFYMGVTPGQLTYGHHPSAVAFHDFLQEGNSSRFNPYDPHNHVMCTTMTINSLEDIQRVSKNVDRTPWNHNRLYPLKRVSELDTSIDWTK